MRIVFTGGGSGGHFYPLIAIADQVRRLAKQEKLVDVDMVYIADEPYDERILFERGIAFRRIRTGKMRRYFSFQNIIDVFKTFFALWKALWVLFILYPDVVVSKGGYASFPSVFAARLLRIPVIVHESDSVPGAVNAWAGKFAEKVAVSYPEAVQYFPENKTAVTGNPVREELLSAPTRDARAEFRLEPAIPTILVLGGSQGAHIINENIVHILPRLTEKYQIIHQAGQEHVESIKKLTHIFLKDDQVINRYKVFGYLDVESLVMAGSVADLVITRAGSSLFEIALWGVPAIVIPLKNSAGNHQKKNAFAYARAGAADVIEEENLSPNILASEIDRLFENKERRNEMRESALKFSSKDAAGKIAQQAIAVLLKHSS